MKELKVLFTGAGRRIELIQAFRNAALRLNINLTIFGADLDMTAPALTYCDYVRKVCRMKDDRYIPELISICQKDKIDLLIPTIDTDLLLLSNHVALFGTTKVLISAPDKIAICRNKNYTSDFFKSCGCYAPAPVNDWRSYEDVFPCFIKPKDGSGSINAFKVESSKELEMYAEQIRDYIVQPFIEGREYTVDIFCDFDGNPIYITPRIRSQVRAGEVLKTQISMDEQIIEECKRIIARFQPVGPMTIQLIRQNTTNKDYFIEINPRFGGGAPLSMKAGARSAEALLSLMVHGKAVCTEAISDGAVFCRFDQSVCVQKGISHQPLEGVIFDPEDVSFGRYGQSLMSYMSDLRNKNVRIGMIVNGSRKDQCEKESFLAVEYLVDDIIFTDDLGGEQFRTPCDIAFRIMQRRWKISFEKIAYVGLHQKRNFQASGQLGMQQIYITDFLKESQIEF